ncbi:anti-sigma factor domain-containing protein [Bacillus marinisedimentorum]|uniref:anti-sigma factor domain-containing protein n=1 Tax=Bacillus marinisedimentorum TaxID=1821260 RepID=UPI000872C492|nr:anti-sigma factor domain-containing protein [Bacillus marinisedimentorum]
MVKRGIIMEINRKKAVVMTRNGAFEQIRLKKGQDVQLGEEILIPEEPQKRVFPSFAPSITVAAAVAAFIIAFAGIFSFNTEPVAAYVSIDVNPSMEVGVNQDMKVLEYTSLNDDGKALQKEIDKLKGLPLAEFVESVVALIKEKGYFNSNQDVLLASTSMLEDKNDKEKMQQALARELVAVQNRLLTQNEEIAVKVVYADEETREHAKQNGISTGKYLVYEDAVKQGNELTMDEAKTLSVTELKKKAEPRPEMDKNGKGVNIQHAGGNKDEKAVPNSNAPGQIKKNEKQGAPGFEDKEPPGQTGKSNGHSNGNGKGNAEKKTNNGSMNKSDSVDKEGKSNAGGNKQKDKKQNNSQGKNKVNKQQNNSNGKNNQ